MDTPETLPTEQEYVDPVSLLLGSDVPAMPEPVQYRCVRLSNAYGKPFVCKLRPLTRREAESTKLLADSDAAIVLKGMISPNLSDPAVIAHVCGSSKAYTADDALQKLFQPGEIDTMSRIIQRLSGYLNTTFTEIRKN